MLADRRRRSTHPPAPERIARAGAAPSPLAAASATHLRPLLLSALGLSRVSASTFFSALPAFDFRRLGDRQPCAPRRATAPLDVARGALTLRLGSGSSRACRGMSTVEGQSLPRGKSAQRRSGDSPLNGRRGGPLRGVGRAVAAIASIGRITRCLRIAGAARPTGRPRVSRGPAPPSRHSPRRASSTLAAASQRSRPLRDLRVDVFLRVPGSLGARSPPTRRSSAERGD